MPVFYDPDKIISWEGEVLEVVEPVAHKDGEIPDYINAEQKARTVYEFKNQDLEVVFQDTRQNILVEGCFAHRKNDDAPVRLIFQRWSDNRITIIIDEISSDKEGMGQP